MIKNHGIDLVKEKFDRQQEDWLYVGAESPTCITYIPELDRVKYLPKGEVQRGAEDMQDCASRGPLNILETKFNWLHQNNKFLLGNLEWLAQNGYLTEQGIEFSDAFIAIKSGTTRNGNSLKAPLQAIHTHGLIPKAMLPLDSKMTWEEYHNPARITQKMIDLGLEFKKRFPINYDIVEEKNFNEVYIHDLIDMAGYAWPFPINGVYPRSNKQINHCFVGISRPKHQIFDNYRDTFDGDFIKNLASDYDMLDYGYRVIISGQ